MKVEVAEFALKDLKYLELNARFMEHAQFQTLVRNLQRDGVLTSVPFLARDDDGSYTILSGNHRVKAAVQAGIERATCLYTDEPLDPQQRIAIQLSHNAIAGKDDPATLKLLYEQLDDIDERLYSGLDDETLELLDDVSPDSLSEANLDFTTVSMVFLPNEAKAIGDAFSAARELVGRNAWLASMKDYDRALDALEKAGASYGVKNVATALRIVLDVFERHQLELSDGWYDEVEQEVRLKQGYVPLSSVFGTDLVPAKAAAVMKRAVEKMIAKDDLDGRNRARAIELWAADWLAGA